MGKLNLNNKAFTLIELLVVVAIIGVLASVVLASLNSIRAKARDAKRLTEAKQLLAAVESYWIDNGGMMTCGYLSSCSGEFASGTCLANALAPYMPKLPLDPLNDFANDYCYKICTEGSGCNSWNPDPNRYFVRIKKESTGSTQDILISR